MDGVESAAECRDVCRCVCVATAGVALCTGTKPWPDEDIRMAAAIVDWMNWVGALLTAIRP